MPMQHSRPNLCPGAMQNSPGDPSRAGLARKGVEGAHPAVSGFVLIFLNPRPSA